MAELRLDYQGIGEILRSDALQDDVRDAAERIAALARAEGHRVASGSPVPIDVFDDPGSDRAGATVAIQHPSGVGLQAHHGILTKAAEAIGLEPEGLET
ncbi:hypothetical protein NLX83_13745 [Allokutzneria sp. A3M-2-11 16]|uniref:hypothetical protein n=1 Tax=Allokutzneria sp. A3M-2-11 16 TaxID=2962043 RepID=UPI0020B81189|nr:hypothetical protein [Allokutzneria sp. A3M-2-11 16]MCP3800322.1 hypothetical protein [Allokutzneria sp. A3M-2-11 16]